MTNKKDLEIKSMLFQGKFDVNINEELLERLEKSTILDWKILDGAELMPSRLKVKLPDKRMCLIVNIPSSIFQLFGAKTEKEAMELYQIVLHDIQKNLKGGVKNGKNNKNKR